MTSSPHLNSRLDRKHTGVVFHHVMKDKSVERGQKILCRNRQVWAWGCLLKFPPAAAPPADCGGLKQITWVVCWDSGRKIKLQTVLLRDNEQCFELLCEWRRYPRWCDPGFTTGDVLSDWFDSTLMTHLSFPLQLSPSWKASSVPSFCWASSPCAWPSFASSSTWEPWTPSWSPWRMETSAQVCVAASVQ